MGTTGDPVVTRAEFDTYNVEQKRTLAIIKQHVEGGGYTIRSLTFITIEDSVSYSHHNFPPESYDCIVGLVALM